MGATIAAKYLNGLRIGWVGQVCSRAHAVYTRHSLLLTEQNITYISPPPYWHPFQVSALAPGPTGSINIIINNNATHTNSYNVTLSLSDEPTAAEMRFKQVPGLSV